MTVHTMIGQAKAAAHFGPMVAKALLLGDPRPLIDGLTELIGEAETAKAKLLEARAALADQSGDVSDANGELDRIDGTLREFRTARARLLERVR